MARQLVTLRRITAVQAIEGNRKLQLTTIDGWTCAVKMGAIRAGDLCLFFEIDCFLPPPADDPRFGETNNPIHHQVMTWNGNKGIHVKSVMVGKNISQGVALSLELFPEIASQLEELGVEHGAETAESMMSSRCFAAQLGVAKWELDSTKAVASLGKPPVFFPSTDLKRVQNCPNLFTPKYKRAIYQESIKMDGSSMTVYYVKRDSPWYKSLRKIDPESRPDMDSGRIGVCSRNADILYQPSNKDRSSEDKSDKNFERFWSTALAHGLPYKLAKINRNIAIQGELCGDGIMQNREEFPAGHVDFFVFSIFDIDAQKALKPRETEQRAAQLGLRHVPVLGYPRLHDIASSHSEILERAAGEGINGQMREGLVFKNIVDGRSFKVIANDYLVKHEE